RAPSATLPLMGGYVSPLSEQDMLDLATHFASLKADEIRDRFCDWFASPSEASADLPEFFGPTAAETSLLNL
ncbi:MAG: hypothetical protein WCF29_26195, partial [Pseudolabrys sp.]